MKTGIKIWIIIYFFVPIFLKAQENDKELLLAEQYFTDGQWSKAENIFDKFIKENSYIERIHDSYFKILLKLEKTKKAEKYFKKLLKKFPDVATYKVNYGQLLSFMGKHEKSKNYYDNYLSKISDQEILLERTALAFIEESLFDYAEKSYFYARKKNPFNYFNPLINLYTKWNKKDKIIQECIEWLNHDPSVLEEVQVRFQNILIEDEEFEQLESIIIKKIQNEPKKIVFNELLLWYYLQRKMFDKAFIQAKAIDKRNNMEGYKIIEIGKKAFENKYYKESIKIFEYLINRYKKKPVYFLARNLLVNAKEEQIKNTFPINIEQIESLIIDYQKLIRDIGINSSTASSVRRMAMLYAFYLNKKDTAINLLKNLLTIRKIAKDEISKIKLDLADIYLLKGSPWEASLTYSQVEKEQKNTQIGHLAKFKKAKVWYYKGEFKLAKAQLNILKLATSREIANDAMDLALLIDENTNLDTTEEAMKHYAAIDLLIFQGLYAEALKSYEQMLKDFPNHPLNDEVLWGKGQLLIKIGQFEQAVETLQDILSAYQHDIWADDANYTIGYIYEDYLNNKEEAMKFYKEQLLNYKGSVYNTDTRKRYRKLRGDKLN